LSASKEKKKKEIKKERKGKEIKRKHRIKIMPEEYLGLQYVIVLNPLQLDILNK
jgi:hypothetical protein